ncbi:hypothetical protein PMI10_01220 [Flavobacterium sp. CF136]|nr:hypothetical protein PMI10_01220 [Flavobacterium sp. CF136]
MSIEIIITVFLVQLDTKLKRAVGKTALLGFSNSVQAY